MNVSVSSVDCLSTNLICILYHELCCSPTYNITVTQIRIGTTLIDSEFTALFDSGTSFTYLVGPSYTRLSESVSSKKCYSLKMLKTNLIYSLSSIKFKVKTLFICSSTHKRRIRDGHLIQGSLLSIVMIWGKIHVAVLGSFIFVPRT